MHGPTCTFWGNLTPFSLVTAHRPPARAQVHYDLLSCRDAKCDWSRLQGACVEPVDLALAVKAIQTRHDRVGGA
jgi:hypothetical protein